MLKATLTKDGAYLATCWLWGLARDRKLFGLFGYQTMLDIEQEYNALVDKEVVFGEADVVEGTDWGTTVWVLDPLTYQRIAFRLPMRFLTFLNFEKYVLSDGTAISGLL